MYICAYICTYVDVYTSGYMFIVDCLLLESHGFSKHIQVILMCLPMKTICHNHMSGISLVQQYKDVMPHLPNCVC